MEGCLNWTLHATTNSTVFSAVEIQSAPRLFIFKVAVCHTYRWISSASQTISNSTAPISRARKVSWMPNTYFPVSWATSSKNLVISFFSWINLTFANLPDDKSQWVLNMIQISSVLCQSLFCIDSTKSRKSFRCEYWSIVTYDSEANSMAWFNPLSPP